MKIKKEAIQKAREEHLVGHAVSMAFLTSVIALHNAFGFGQERAQRFADEFTKIIKEYRNRYDEVALEALTSHAARLGIEVNWV